MLVPFLDKLSQEDTYCTVTGQQVGLLTGPMYTIWKALTAIQFSRKVEAEKGISCVPIFWMATEDHNWHEIMHFSLLKEDFELLQFSLKEHLFLKRQPTGAVPTSNEEVRKILLRAFREVPVQEVKNFYSTGTLAQAFARTLLWLLKDFPILLLDPSDPELKKLAKPFFVRFFDQKQTILEALANQNEILKKQNYPVQVNMEENQLPLFYLNGQDRLHIKTDDDFQKLPPEKLSPSALLRPVMRISCFRLSLILAALQRLLTSPSCVPGTRFLRWSSPGFCPASVSLWFLHERGNFSIQRI